MPLDYFIWLLRAPDGQEIVVDTGFDEETAAGRGRTIARNVRDSLKAMGTDAAKVSDVIITHLHYDHAGSLGMFPGAKFHLQEREMHFATGRHMCVHAIRLPFEAAHVVAMVKALYADRVVFHDGDGEVAPGVSVHRVGGHSDGLQVVRVQTARGPVVLASDAMHFYANALSGNPFPIIYDLGAMAAGWRAAKKLAGGDDSRVIPGHDPDVRRRFPEVPGQGGEVVALHLPPKD
jgi:glyoxylase-like metal-dependent hydrolase (beta-lactamase superfamily II)